MKKNLLITLLFFTITQINAQQIVRNYSNEFLNIGIGARAMSMSKSVSSFSSGVEAGYWNPAGIISVQDYEFSIMHNSLFNGIGSYDYFGAALPVEKNDIAVGVSIIRLGVDNILNTTNLIDNNGNIDFNNISSFSSSDVAGIISIAKHFSRYNLDIGVNTKFIRRNIGDFARGNGFGFDIGVKYKYKNVKLGLTIRDVTTSFTAWKVNDTIFDKIANAQTIESNQNQEKPEKYELTLPKFQLGASYFKQLNEKYSLLTAMDLIGRFTETNDIFTSKNISFSPNLGFELGYKNIAFFRTGVGNIQKEIDFDNSITTTLEPNLGIGIKIKNVDIDYAITNIGASTGVNFSNIFSIKIELNEMK